VRLTIQIACAVSAVLALAATALAGPSAGAAPIQRFAGTTTVLDVPRGFEVSEPHVAADPDDPDTLYVVANAVGPELGVGLLWRTRDGGRSWTRFGPLGGTGATPRGFDADAVLAAGHGGLLLYASLALDVDEAAGTAPLHVGTRVSTDRGATFPAYGSADQVTLPLCLFFGCPPPPDLEGLDTPWLAVDAARPPFRTSAYLVWVHDRAGRHELRFAASHDGGRTFAEPPLVLDRTTSAELDGLEELPHVVVRPGGLVDVTWNAVRDGAVAIVHAISSDRGATFSRAEKVLRLRPDASRLGVATTLAVSPKGRLGLCWREAAVANPVDGRVACKITDRRGRWGIRRDLLPGSDLRQYLPAAAFRGERLRVVAYVSDETSTRVLAAVETGRGFSNPVEVDEWPVPGSRVCAPRPPECGEAQTFIGDYIGFAATRRRLVAAYVAPSADATRPNRVVVSTFEG
jgi:hypothetical protein